MSSSAKTKRILRMERVNLGTLSGNAQSTRIRLLCRFQSLSSLLTRVWSSSSLWYSEGDNPTNGDSSYKYKCFFQRVTPTWFSEFSSDFSFSQKVTSLINMPKRHILGQQTLFPYKDECYQCKCARQYMIVLKFEYI